MKRCLEGTEDLAERYRETRFDIFIVIILLDLLFLFFLLVSFLRDRIGFQFYY